MFTTLTHVYGLHGIFIVIAFFILTAIAVFALSFLFRHSDINHSDLLRIYPVYGTIVTAVIEYLATHVSTIYENASIPLVLITPVIVSFMTIFFAMQHHAKLRKSHAFLLRFFSLLFFIGLGVVGFFINMGSGLA